MMADSSDLDAAAPPYLTLTLPQSLCLPDPPSPEPRSFASVNDLLDARAQLEEHGAGACGHRVAVGFPVRVDGGAETTWACKRGVHTLTFAQLPPLARTLAKGLQSRLFPSGCQGSQEPNGSGAQQDKQGGNGSNDLVALLAPSGIELFAHLLACWRLGLGVVCIAPGTTAPAIANLLRLTSARALLAHVSQLEPARAGISELTSSNAADVSCPLLVEMNDSQVHDILHGFAADQDAAKESQIGPRERGQEDAKEGEAGPEDTLVVMHTSGSTGLPKPIYQLHRFWTHSLISAKGTDKAAFTSTPLYHGGMSDYLRALQAGASIYFFPSAGSGAMTADSITRAVSSCPEPISYFLSVPYILKLLLSSPKGENMLACMDLVSTGGAPLPQATGDEMVERGIKLVSRLGSSECGFLMSSFRAFELDSDWSWLRVLDELGQRLLRFERSSEGAGGGLCELVVDAGWPTKLVANRDDGSYATGDLYEPHPTRQDTWRYAARADDTLVMVNGKKFAASPPESILRSSPLLSEALIFGANRALAGALLFPSSSALPANPSDSDIVTFLSKLKPTIEAANAASPSHAQLTTELLLVQLPDAIEQLPRASKGTVQRGRAYAHFASLIDEAYLRFEDGELGHAPKVWLERAELRDWLQNSIERIVGEEGKVGKDTDLFVAGVNSIQTARIRAAVHQNIDLGGRKLSMNVIYEHPSVEKLAEHITAVHTGNVTELEDTAQYELMRELVRRYSKFEIATPIIPEQPTRDGLTIILTGATGALGAHLLSTLLSAPPSGSPRLRRVICLVRAKSDQHAAERIAESLHARKLPSITGTDKVRLTCHAAQLGEERLGLSQETYDGLQEDSVITVHAAWAVNFAGGLQSFEQEHIAGLHNLLALHRASQDPVHFAFCSSTASILGSGPPDPASNSTSASTSTSSAGFYPETLPQDPSSAAPLGYARSKWVAEHICFSAASASSSDCVGRRGGRGGGGDSVSVMRVGQLCGDTVSGIWNESEGWPLMIRTANEVGALPEIDESLTWLPVDIAARSILEISLSNRRPSASATSAETLLIYHIASPIRSPPHWSALLTWLSSSGLRFETLPPGEWCERLRARRGHVKGKGMFELWARNYDTATVPQVRSQHNALPSPQFDTTRARASSPTLSSAPAVSEKLVRKTLDAWIESGFLRL